MKKLFAIALAFFAFNAMAAGYYYETPSGSVFFNNTHPNYGNPSVQQRMQTVPVVPVYPTYQQNNQTYQQYRLQPNTIQNYTYPANSYQQYHTSPQYPREYYERNNDAQKFNQCRQRWERSGFNSRYDTRARACMVEVNRGMWVPESSISFGR